MKTSHLLSATALASVLVIAPTSAFAQDNQTNCVPTADAPCPPETTDSASIVVTGSRIRSPNVTSDIPMTSIGGDALIKSANTSIGDELNNLPQLASTFSQQNPGSGIGIAGLNLLDLRGLGTQRTLVLVNGRRHVAADILNNAVSPDVSSIPSNLIERVDIVTGGNSAVYGSDAIAGVVNFVLKRNFSGVEIRGNAGVAAKGFGGNQSISAMAGKNFGDGKGNITATAEYTRQERVYASDVPWFRQNNALATVDADSGGLVSASDGFPDAVFVRDIRSATINPYGLIPVTQKNSAGALCGNGTLANNGGPNNAGTAYNCNYIFNVDGRLVAETGSRFGTGPTGSFIGGNGQTGREGKTVSILPFLERYNFNLIGHYEVAPALEFFVEAKWDRVNALGNNSGPSFIQTGAGVNGNIGDQRERPRIDNPFLNPADRTTLANAILASGCNTSLTTICPAAGNLSATDIANIGNGSYRFQLARNLLDVGLRDEKFQRDTLRVVGGIRGTFNDDWTYEISANYGRFDQTTVTDGFIDRQRFSLAMDAGLDPATNTIKCRSQYDPASAFPIARTDAVSVGIAPQNAARLAADIAACKPYNPFGGTDNSASIAYFSHRFNADASLEQLDFTSFVSGDLSQLFELPGGPIRFAIGSEYRQESAYYKQDDFTANGFSNGVAIPVFSPPDFKVTEGFGELQIPLLKDLPFFQELTATGAARVSHYQGGTGTVWAYNGGVQWSPIKDIRFRANYARAVRAPNVSETGFPLVPNFANGFIDPCSANAIGANSNRQTNCTTAVGAGNLSNINNLGYALPIVSGSNPNLQAETSDSYTFGAVIQPRFIPGLSLTVDYYNIRVNGVIASIAAQTIANNCYDAPSLNNIFCQQFQRFAGPGLGPNGEKPGAILGNTLVQAPLNFARRIRKGVDFDLSYRTRLTDNMTFNSSVIYVHTLKVSDYQDPTNPNFENRILGEVGYPTDEFRLDADLTLGEFTFGYRLHYIGAMYVGAWENFNGLNGSPPLNLDATEPQKYPAITYNDFRLEWNLASGGRKDAFQFYGGVDNAFNQLPPLGTTATGVGTAIYDFRGRTVYAGFRARFF